MRMRLKLVLLAILGSALAGPVFAAADDMPAVAKQAVFDSAQYGPVGVGEGLWNAARAVNTRYPDANIYQIIWALYTKNPIAFQDNHIGKLKRGAFLDVPSKRQVMRVDAEQAQRNINQMMATLPRPEPALPPVESRIVVSSSDKTVADKSEATKQKSVKIPPEAPVKPLAGVSHESMAAVVREDATEREAESPGMVTEPLSEPDVTEKTAVDRSESGLAATEPVPMPAHDNRDMGSEASFISALKDSAAEQSWNMVLLGSLLLFSLGFLVLRRKNAEDDDGWTTITEYVDPKTETSVLSERLAAEMNLRLDIAGAYNELSRFRDVEPILEPVLEAGGTEHKLAAQELINELPGKIS